MIARRYSIFSENNGKNERKYYQATKAGKGVFIIYSRQIINNSTRLTQQIPNSQL